MTMIHQIVIKYYVTVKLQTKNSELASMRCLWSDHILEKTKLLQLKMKHLSCKYYWILSFYYSCIEVRPIAS